VMDNGFMIGFRHSIAMNVGFKGHKENGSIFEGFDENTMLPNGKRAVDMLDYNLNFSLGFMFGK
ncbi:MAG: hypothetical protein ACRCV0_04085, partial [Brevinema sp.]